MIILESDDKWPEVRGVPRPFSFVVAESVNFVIQETGIPPTTLVISHHHFRVLKNSFTDLVAFPRTNSYAEFRYRGMRVLRSEDVQLALF